MTENSRVPTRSTDSCDSPRSFGLNVRAPMWLHVFETVTVCGRC
jgi:hypothetical protein